MSAFRIYNAHFHNGRNPYSSAGSVSTLRGIEPLMVGAGKPQDLSQDWAEGSFQPYFGAMGVGGQSKVIRDSIYDPELNEALRLKINQPLNAPALSRFYGTTPVNKLSADDIENPEHATDNIANHDPSDHSGKPFRNPKSAFPSVFKTSEDIARKRTAKRMAKRNDQRERGRSRLERSDGLKRQRLGLSDDEVHSAIRRDRVLSNLRGMRRLPARRGLDYDDN